MHGSTKNFLVFTLYIAMTLVMTYPLIVDIDRGVNDRGDPLLNSWILAWNVHKIASLDFKNYFDANIFYPHQRTLAYSEHLFPQSLVALPVLFLSGNPILGHNIVFLLAFATSAFGMFLFASFLTKNRVSGIVAGIIYAFSPFMFAHLPHVQVLCAGGIPLALLFLHKFLASERYQDLLLFTLFYILQVLANGYYAAYLTLYVGLIILFYALARRKYRSGRFWLQLGIFLGLVLVFAGPFFIQYFELRRQMGFSRPIGFSARLIHFLAVPPANWIYGDLAKFARSPEGMLFPGLVAVLLALFGLVSGFKKAGSKSEWQKPLFVYTAVLVLSFLFSFGEKGPFSLLHKYVPGFDALRAVTRVHIFTMLSLAVLASYGVDWLWARLGKRLKFCFAAAIPILLFVEYLSVPVPLTKMPIKKEIPQVYPWLASQKEDFALLELPLPRSGRNIARIEGPRVYFSSYHWKKLVNGYSGYIPPLYDELQRRGQDFSLVWNLEDLKALNVRYLILHSSPYDEAELKPLLAEFLRLEKEVRLAQRFEDAYVFELIYRPEDRIKPLREKLLPLSLEGCQVDSNVSRDRARHAVDGSMRTRWDSGPQRKGHFFEIDLGSDQTVKGLSLKLNRDVLDYPRGYLVEVSADAIIWQEVARQDRTRLPLTAFLKPKDLALEILFPPAKARYIKITNTGEDPVNYWSIYELTVFQ